MQTGEETGSIGYSVDPECGSLSITLTYRSGEQSIRERVRIIETACHFGGWRPWFQCPRCYRSSAKLYLRGARFACRRCHRLVYASQSEDAIGRSWRRQSRLEARLGDDWGRPKGMHQRTYDRLLERVWACEAQREAALAVFLGRLMSREPSLRDDPLFSSYA